MLQGSSFRAQVVRAHHQPHSSCGLRDNAVSQIKVVKGSKKLAPLSMTFVWTSLLWFGVFVSQSCLPNLNLQNGAMHQYDEWAG
jgi:hypothetical protein